jgi:hypothetical protein
VIGFPGQTITPTTEPQQSFSLEAFPGDIAGVFVG